MTDNETMSLNTVEAFFDALQSHNNSGIETLLDSDAVVTVATSFDGSQEPPFEFAGKEAAFGYLGSIGANFSQVAFSERRIHVVAGGGTVFVEAKGDLIVRSSGKPYRNVYVFKFTFDHGSITGLTEYGNPVTFAKAFDLPLGETPPPPQGGTV
jgi:ketosteroid isomerase-like protein